MINDHEKTKCGIKGKLAGGKSMKRMKKGKMAERGRERRKSDEKEEEMT